MGKLGNLKIDKSEALSKSSNIRTYANNVKDILEAVSAKMNEIDDENAGIYQGTSRSRDLKEQLDVIKQNFEPIYNQIMAFANQIDMTVNAASNQ